uniref:Uncharacterized protein n=1 Tax=Lepeophtheirus salmonis TaxID=72036 RepID=A0A0K2URT2_LEPSM
MDSNRSIIPNGDNPQQSITISTKKEIFREEIIILNRTSLLFL